MASKSYDLEPVQPTYVYADSQPLAQTSAIMRSTTPFDLEENQAAIVIFDPINLKNVDLVDDDGTFYGKDSCMNGRAVFSSSGGTSQDTPGGTLHAGVQITVTATVEAATPAPAPTYKGTAAFRVNFNSGHFRVTFSDPDYVGFRAYDWQGNQRATGQWQTLSATPTDSGIAYKTVQVKEGLGKVELFNQSGVIATWYPAGFPNSPCASNNPANPNKGQDSDAGSPLPGGPRHNQDWTLTFDNLPATVNADGKWELHYTLSSKVVPRGLRVMTVCYFQTLANTDQHTVTELTGWQMITGEHRQVDQSYLKTGTIYMPGDTRRFLVGIADGWPYGDDSNAALNGAQANALQGGLVYLNSGLKSAGWVGNYEATVTDGIGTNVQTLYIDTTCLYGQQSPNILITMTATHETPPGGRTTPVAAWYAYNTKNEYVKFASAPRGDIRSQSWTFADANWNGAGLSHIEYGTQPQVTGGAFTKVGTWYPTGHPNAPGAATSAETGYAQVADSFDETHPLRDYNGGTTYFVKISRPFYPPWENEQPELGPNEASTGTYGAVTMRYTISPAIGPQESKYLYIVPTYPWWRNDTGEAPNEYARDQGAAASFYYPSTYYPGQYNPYAIAVADIHIYIGTNTYVAGIDTVLVGKKTKAYFMPLPIGRANTLTGTSAGYPYRRPLDQFFYASIKVDSSGTGALTIRPIVAIGPQSIWDTQLILAANAPGSSTIQVLVRENLDKNTEWPKTFQFTGPAWNGDLNFTLAGVSTQTTEPVTRDMLLNNFLGNAYRYVNRTLGPTSAEPFYKVRTRQNRVAWVRVTNHPTKNDSLLIYYFQQELTSDFNLMDEVDIRATRAGTSEIYVNRNYPLSLFRRSLSDPETVENKTVRFEILSPPPTFGQTTSFRTRLSVIGGGYATPRYNDGNNVPIITRIYDSAGNSLYNQSQARINPDDTKTWDFGVGFGAIEWVQGTDEFVIARYDPNEILGGTDRPYAHFTAGRGTAREVANGPLLNDELMEFWAQMMDPLPTLGSNATFYIRLFAAKYGSDVPLDYGTVSNARGSQAYIGFEVFNADGARVDSRGGSGVSNPAGFPGYASTVGGSGFGAVRFMYIDVNKYDDGIPRVLATYDPNGILVKKMPADNIGATIEARLNAVGDRDVIACAPRQNSKLYYIVGNEPHYFATGPFKDDLYEGGLSNDEDDGTGDAEQFKGSDTAFRLTQGINGLGTGVVSIIGQKKVYTLDEVKKGITITTVGTSSARPKSRYALGLTDIHSALQDEDGGVLIDAILKITPKPATPTPGTPTPEEPELPPNQDEDPDPTVDTQIPILSSGCRRGHFTNLLP